MRRPATLAAAGLAGVAASLLCAAPALADIGGPAPGAVALVALVVVGAIVTGVVVVCILVLRGIARSRYKTLRYCDRCGAQTAADAPYCLSCGFPHGADSRSAEEASEAMPGSESAAQADKTTQEDEPT